MYLHYPKLPKRRWILILIPLSLTFVAWNLTHTLRPASSMKRTPTLPSTVNWIPTDAKEGVISLLTYNIAGLPEPLSSAKTPRGRSIRTIGERLNQFDVVNVQEDFNYNDELYSSGNSHPFRTKSMGKVPFGDGLNTLSRFPISELRRVKWSDCTGADCFTPKGFSYAKLQLAKEVWVDIYNVHANAQDSKEASAARRKNMRQLLEFMDVHSKGQAVILMGDFNANYRFELDNIRDFVVKAGVLDTWVYLKNKGRIPRVETSFKALEMLHVHDNCETIDKIIFRNSERIHFTPQSYKVEIDAFKDRVGMPLSDHLAVGVTLHWEYCTRKI